MADPEVVLIKLVKDRKILYDPQLSKSCSYAALKKYRDACWNEIANIIGLNRNICQRIWHQLRDNLLEAVYDVRRDTVTGEPVVLFSSIAYKKEMEFLIPFLELVPKRSDVENQNADVNETNSDTEVENQTTPVAEETIPRKRIKLSSYPDSKESDDILSQHNDEDPAEAIELSDNQFSDEEEDGELVIKFAEETIIIPVKQVKENEKTDNDFQVIVKPIGNFNCSDSRGAMFVELEDESVEELEFNILENNLDEILSDIYNESEEDDIELASDIPKKLNMLHTNVQDSFSSPNQCSCGQNDDECECSHYNELSMLVNQLKNPRDRLKLRRDVNELVLSRVSEILENESK